MKNALPLAGLMALALVVAAPARPDGDGSVDWIKDLVERMEAAEFDAEGVVAFLGPEAAQQPGIGAKVYSSDRFARVRIDDDHPLYQPCALYLDVEVAPRPDLRPLLTDLEALLGPSRPMPPACDDFTSGPIVAMPRREPAENGLRVRIFAELTEEEPPRVVTVDIDRSRSCE